MNRTFRNALSIYGDVFDRYPFLLSLWYVTSLTAYLVFNNLRWQAMRLRGGTRRRINDAVMELNFRNVGSDLNFSNIYKQLAIDGTREPLATRKMKQWLGKGDIILEVGANIGYYVLLEAKRIGPSGRIYAIEPEPQNIAALQKNIHLNNIQNRVTVDQLAITDKKSTVTMDVSAQSNRHMLSTGAAASTFTVPGLSIDDYLRGKRIPDLVRMDIEGAEYLALRGAPKTLGRKKLKLFLEIHPEQLKMLGSSARDVLLLLKHHGFRLDCLMRYDRMVRKRVGFAEELTIDIDTLLKRKDLLDHHEAFEAFFVK